MMSDHFPVEGCINYAYNSKKLNMLGYMDDGFSITRDFGDKVFGTYGSDYSVFNIQEELRNVIKTQAGKIELLSELSSSCTKISTRTIFRR